MKKRAKPPKYLLLDSTGENQLRLAILKDKVFSHEHVYKVPVHAGKSPLHFITAFLGETKIEPASLQGIFLVEGAGRFSALRASASVGLTLGYVLNIPMATIRQGTPAAATKAIPRLLKRLTVSPRYGAEPNITLKKA